MATIHYSNSGSDATGDGSLGNPYQTATFAISQAVDGDIVDGNNEVYNEVIAVDKEITFQNAIFDGMWDGTFPVPSSGVLPGGGDIYINTNLVYLPMIRIQADNVLVDNVTVRRGTGRGFSTSDPSGTINHANVTYRNCTSHGHYNMSWHATQFTNLLIEDCISHNNGKQGLDPNNPIGDTPVNIQNVNGTGVIVRRCTVFANRGEGIGAQQGCDDFEIVDNLIYGNGRMGIYLMWSTNGLVARNTLYLPRQELLVGTNPDGIYIAWESNFEAAYSPAFDAMNTLITDNVVINHNRNFFIAYNGGSNVNGPIGITVSYNTFVNAYHDVATTNGDGIRLLDSPNASGNLFCNNIIHQDLALADLAFVDVAAGWTFTDNAWSSTPPAVASSGGDIIGGITMIAPNSTLDFFGDYDVNNYKLVETPTPSPLIDAGSCAAQSTDNLGLARDASPDIGALEAGATAANNPPTLTNPGSQTNTEGDTVSLFINATDPDIGDVLTYSASGLPAGLSINTSTGEISGTTTTAGVFTSTVAVDDGNGGSDSAVFTWTVNAAPVGCSDMCKTAC